MTEQRISAGHSGNERVGHDLLDPGLAGDHRRPHKRARRYSVSAKFLIGGNIHLRADYGFTVARLMLDAGVQLTSDQER